MVICFPLYEYANIYLINPYWIFISHFIVLLNNFAIIVFVFT